MKFHHGVNALCLSGKQLIVSAHILTCSSCLSCKQEQLVPRHGMNKLNWVSCANHVHMMNQVHQVLIFVGFIQSIVLTIQVVFLSEPVDDLCVFLVFILFLHGGPTLVRHLASLSTESPFFNQKF